MGDVQVRSEERALGGFLDVHCDLQAVTGQVQCLKSVLWQVSFG
jgi:hypothetical protein